MRVRAETLFLACLAVAALLAALPAAAQEEAAAKPLLAIEEIIVEPSSPSADTLCRLRIRLSNAGEEIASRFAFAVSLNGQDLGVYANQIFMYPVAPGATEELPLYNFWSTETSRAMPVDGKLEVQVTLREATWSRRSTETDEEGEIEVWEPIGPVPGLPVRGSVTLRMKTAG